MLPNKALAFTRKLFVLTMIFFSSTLLMSGLAHANNIKAMLKNGQLYWQNAYYKDSTCNASSYGYEKCLVPSFWTPVDKLTPTSTWIPGNVEALGDATLAVSDSSNTVNAQFKLVGLEYHTGSTTQSDNGAVSSSVTCQTSGSYSAPMIAVADTAGCLHSHSLGVQTSDGNSVRQEPFAFVRPIFAVNETAIKASFASGGTGGTPLAAGLYRSATEPFSYKYDFYFDPPDAINPARTRRYLSGSYSLEIEHVVSYINVAVDNSTKQMDVMYFPDGQIEGRSFFEFTVSGALPNGFKVSLDAGKDYLLTNGDSSIPYQLTWRKSSEEFVDIKGQVNTNYVSPDSYTDSDSCASSCIRNLDVYFEINSNSPDSNLTTGTYTDTFFVMFEPNDL